MYFRNENDKLHYFGSMGLSVFFLFLYTWLFDKMLPGYPGWQYFVLGYVFGMLTANVLGGFFEALEQWVFHPYSDIEYWEKKPYWIYYYFSGDDWDWADITFNFLGSTIIHPIVMLAKDFGRSR